MTVTPNKREPAQARNHVEPLADMPSVLEELGVDDGIDFEPEAVTLDLQVPDL